MEGLMDKVLFTLKVHSIVDVITNSSSELFVGKNQSKDEMIEMIEEIYPHYLNEYDELKSIDDLTISELEGYLSYYCTAHCYPASRSQYPILDGFTFDELYEPKKDWKTGKVKKAAWNGELQYALRDNLKDKDNNWNTSFVTEENFEDVKNKLDPNREMYFLYSIYDNPNWDYQEKLELFMTRIHMG